MARRRSLWQTEAPPSTELRSQIAALASPLRMAADLDPLLDRIGSSRVVLLGEASHGTAEYYAWRMRISQRLMEEKGFNLKLGAFCDGFMSQVLALKHGTCFIPEPLGILRVLSAVSPEPNKVAVVLLIPYQCMAKSKRFRVRARAEP